MNKKLKNLLLLLAVFAAFSVSAQAQTQSRQQTGTTDAGRRVILNDDGTWKYADGLEAAAQTDEVDGMAFKLLICRRDMKIKQIACTFEITNKKDFKDDTRIYKNTTRLTDNFGNETSASGVKTGTVNDGATILAGRTIRAIIYFDIADQNAVLIKNLKIARSDKMGNVNQSVEFANIKIQK